MNKASNIIITKFLIYIYTILVAYILSVSVSFFLPKNSIEFQESSAIKIDYDRYMGFYSTKTININNRKQIINQTLNKYELKAIYSTTNHSGWAIVQNKTTKESSILTQFSKLDNYKLIRLYKDNIVFELSGKEYNLQIQDLKIKLGDK
ncbi:hypothetical protein [Halarcobacter bivalviorum]|uniref:Uncharacterized protein n=1 Tax=Halarcobacter bivalviorum TaxID=663364 RepID=A0AAX2AAJ6_9BACT|nr:hypothetical protein [Halarcobacter bivalviorum]RXK11284.1 hypothetical protein CRV05_02650 [Halarcobacter bivalviorum]